MLPFHGHLSHFRFCLALGEEVHSTFATEYCFGGFPGEGPGVKTVPRLTHKPLPYSAGGPQLLLPGVWYKKMGRNVHTSSNGSKPIATTKREIVSAQKEHRASHGTGASACSSVISRPSFHTAAKAGSPRWARAAAAADS